MPQKPPAIWWVRRDMRLADNPCLAQLVATGRPVIPVFLCDEVVEALGAAPAWRMGLAAQHFAGRLAAHGSRLILRRGRAAQALAELAQETGAEVVRWTRAYDAEARSRDREVFEALDGRLDAGAVGGHLLAEPWQMKTRAAQAPYRVFTPYWRAFAEREFPAPPPAPRTIQPPSQWPHSEDIADWRLSERMRRGAAVVGAHASVGEEAAQSRLQAFLSGRIADYERARDDLARPATSQLSEHLTYGEIGPRACWQAGLRAEAEGAPGARPFLRQLAWREFAYHLMWHFPAMRERNWRPEWDAFPWRTDGRSQALRRWRRGRTGVEIVDAAQREMYVTGTMHNRARMIAASYLTKHCLVHWRLGLAWFEECLTDWDPASNALGWQWVAGCGPDAAPFFRVFNPQIQAAKFDADGSYRRRWLAEGRPSPSPTALSYFEAIPPSWRMSPSDPYPEPVVDLVRGREAALSAYRAFKQA